MKYFYMECTNCGQEFRHESFDEVNHWVCSCDNPSYQSGGDIPYSDKELDEMIGE